MEGLNQEECPTSILGELASVGDRAACVGMGSQGQRTQKGLQGDLAEREAESREGRTQARGWWSLGGSGDALEVVRCVQRDRPHSCLSPVLPLTPTRSK